MFNPNYTRQLQNGMKQVMCEQIPDNAFIDAIKVREVCKARILTRAEKKSKEPGTPDVILRSATGEIKSLSRSEFVKNYVHASGHKIVMAFLKSGVDYTVCSNTNEQYKIMKLPQSYNGSLGGKNIRSGSYLICRADEEGNMDKNNMYVVSDKVFKKMFKIPMQNAIKRNIGKTSTANATRPMPLRSGSVPIATNISNTKAMGGLSLNKGVSIDKPKMDTNRLGMNPRTNENAQAQENNKYRYVLTHKIVDMNSRKAIGYVVKDIKSQASRQCTFAQVNKLCEAKLVSNAKFVYNTQKGYGYLAGVGVSLTNLPEVIA